MQRLLAGLIIALGCHFLLLLMPIRYNQTIPPRLPRAGGISVGLSRMEPKPPRNHIRPIPPPPEPIAPLVERIEKKPNPKPERKPAPRRLPPRKKPESAVLPETGPPSLPKKKATATHRKVPDKRLAVAPLPDPPDQIAPEFTSITDKASKLASSADTPAPKESKSKESSRISRAYPESEGNLPPPYPVLARRRGWQGTVQLSVLVLEDGRVGEITVAKSSGHPILDETALKAVARYRFVPGKKDGRPVAMRVRVPVHFRLQDDN